MSRNQAIEFLAGGASGLVADGVTHPVDTVRTRLWMQGAGALRQPAGSGYQYTGLWHGFSDIVKKEGVRSLFKGFGSVALLSPVAHGLYFGSYEWAKRALKHKTSMKESSMHAVAGFWANGVGALIWTPMDVVKQKEQALIGKLYRGPLDGLIAVYKEGGITRGLMRGYWSGMATYGPFSSIYFWMYEAWKVECAKFTAAGSVEGLHTGHFVVGGGLAGTCAAIATAPIDLIKTRIQVDSGYSGILNTTMRILREEGMGVFFRGIGARVLWVAPGCAITIALFEDVRRIFGGAGGG